LKTISFSKLFSFFSCIIQIKAVYLQQIKIRKLMKEKRYTLPEEQKDAAFAAEPAPAYHGNAAIALPEDECAEEDIDWNKIPVGWHPANEEEAVARIEAIEAEYENGQYIDAEEFEKELIAQYPWLA